MTDAARRKAILDDFVAEARRQTLLAVWERLGPAGVKLRNLTTLERACACPVHGGHDGDEFAMNLGKQVFFCRKTGDGGDALAMAAHLTGADLKSADRAVFMAVCAAALGRDPPDPSLAETDDQRAAREAASAQARARAESESAERERQANEYRARAIRNAREKWQSAAPAGRIVRAYLAGRAGFSPDPFPAALRFSASEHFAEDLDRDGKSERLWTGPAMIAPFVDRSLAVIGCHRTWIDVENRPKLRPEFWVLTEPGVAAGRPAWPLPVDRAGRPPAADIAAGFYRALASKKMLGGKKGGFIPVCGKSSAQRWVAAEGIENVARVAAAEDYRRDTFYCAAGDLGNLAGKADHASDFRHPSLKKPDRNGALRPVKIAGPVPAPVDALAPDECMPVFDHVETMILIADGDSEPVMTQAAMARARARCERPGRVVALVWPPAGADIADIPVLDGES